MGRPLQCTLRSGLVNIVSCPREADRRDFYTYNYDIVHCLQDNILIGWLCNIAFYKIFLIIRGLGFDTRRTMSDIEQSFDIDACVY